MSLDFLYQRLGLAEIFMKNVDIAILDEPTSSLDPMATADFLETIQLLKHEGVAVLMSSTAGWSANSRGMLANGSSRGSLTLVRLTMPIAPVIAAVTKLAWAEKHIGAHFRVSEICQTGHDSTSASRPPR